MKNESEYEDDPKNSSEEGKKQKKKIKESTRKSSRLSKKPKLIKEYASSEEEDNTTTTTTKSIRKSTKHRKKLQLKNVSTTPRSAPTSFVSGAFVVLKRDAQNCDCKNPPVIWRIDGKALLQKFEPFKKSDMLYYKNTSVYTGWSDLETENYAVMKSVNFINNTSHKVEITLDMSEFKSVITDSD